MTCDLPSLSGHSIFIIAVSPEQSLLPLSVTQFSKEQMADAIVSALISSLWGTAVKLISDEVRLIFGDEGHARKLQQVLARIQDVLDDAEEKQVEEESIKLWLKDLKEIAHEGEDILDEFEYEATKKKVRSYFYVSNPIGFKVREIDQKLLHIEKEKELLQLNEKTENTANLCGQETISFVDVSTVIGRDSDKSKIVNLCMEESGSTLSLIRIVGLRGLGKTTLAKLVYNHESIKTHFELRMWVWVSSDFDLKRLLIQMLDHIPNEKRESPSEEMLQKKLTGKRFLLVLDDVWGRDNDELNRLILLLRCGATGSKIIVTMPSKVVAPSVESLHTYPLEVLSKDECWALFERETFMLGRPERTLNLEKIGRHMIKKCGGLPLAVKTLGGFMRSKKEHEWQAAMNCEIWNMPIRPNKIIEALKLSYNDLRPRLKQCLLYCVTFPKDYCITKETLVQLWMAQGYLKESTGSELMEDIGDKYFDILYSESFFVDVQKNKAEDIKLWKVHNLVHDLARSIDKFGFQVLETDNQIPREDLSECRHLSLIFDSTRSTIPEISFEMKKLRSLFLHKSYNWGDRHMVTLITSFNSTSLRVLDLSGTSIKRLQLPIDKLKHLKYLDLSHTDIEELPEFVTQLYSLQTLKLEQCKHLEKLPDDLANLVNLRHLHIDSSGKWEEMPQKIERLRFLQTLPIFILSKEDPRRSIKELELLVKLQGRLEIFRLEDAEGKMFTKKGSLKGMENIHTLSLQWSDVRRGKNFQRLLELLDNDEHDNDVAVLERLQPHSNIKKLKIQDFRGAKCPRWLTSGSELSSLVEMNLWGCYKLEYIPCFGELPSLKVLHLRDMRKLKCLDRGSQQIADHKASTTTTNEQEATVGEAKGRTLYPSLKQLMLVEMPDLEEWFDDAGLNSPSLEQLTVQKCSKLRKTPNLFPSLKKLVFKEVNGKGLGSITSCLTSLTSLSINRCGDLTFFIRRGAIEE